MTAKPAVTITKIEGYSDGLTLDSLGTPVCAFHATVTYTTAGHIPKVRNAVAILAKDYNEISYWLEVALGASPFNPGPLYVPRDNQALTTGGSTYMFAAWIYSKSDVLFSKNGAKFIEFGETSQFSLDPATYVNGCPAASATPLVSNTF